MVRPAAKREAVAYLREHFQMSERRACSVLAADRKMIRYASRRPPEMELRERLRDLANERRRFGYRRLFILRRRRPDAPRPFKVPGYPLLPALYVLFAATIMIVLVLYRTQTTWPGLLIALTGIPVYFLWRRFGGQANSR